MIHVEDEEQGDERTALKSNHEKTDAPRADAVPAGAAPSGKESPTIAVKFVNGTNKNDDVSIDLRQKDEDFVGLKKEELEKYASDPYWVRMRIIFLVLFAIIWVGMLVAAIVIIIVAPKCPYRPDQEWWETAVVYQLNPNSFLDTDGDGKGDIKGIEKKLKYLKDTLKVTALNVGPIYPSESQNFGYDITDFQSISSHYGTMDDFTSLLDSMRKEGMKLILDFIPNHTSRNHTWFTESRKDSSADNRFRDFYIWQKSPPNAWENVYGESAWSLDDTAGEYYYHSYSSDEPDLNLNNPEVIKLLNDALLFWLENKVDGFRFIGVEHLIEPKDLTDQNTEILPETYKLIADWRKVIDGYSFSDKLPRSRQFPRVLIVDVDQNANESAKFLEYDGLPGAHLATNKVLQQLKKSCEADCVYSLLTNVSAAIESDSKIANWQVGNYNTSHIVTRMGGKDYLNAINMLLLTLPGTTMVYNGDELGMKNVVFYPNSTYSIEQKLIPRAGQHSPMQWSDKPNAGFTSGTPWIPVADDYSETNVEAETAHGSGMSHIKVFAVLAALKQEPSIKWGVFNLDLHKSVVFYVRQAKGFAGFLVAINFGPQSSTVNFKDSRLKDLLPDEGKIVASTYNFDGAGRHENYKVETVINLGTVVYLKPSEGIVLKWEPKINYM